MRLIPLIAGLLITLSAPALAQEAPPVEVFGGYSYFRPDGGGNLHGWNASVAVNIKNWFEIVGDFSGHYGSQSSRTVISNDEFPQTITIRADSDVSTHVILVGPRFSYRRNPKLTPFIHLLFGASRLGADATISLGNITVDSSFSDIGFAAAVGGGVDLRVSESVGVRLIQADYLGTAFGGSNQGNIRLSVGLVLR
jgi:hypothetical protein